MSFKIRRRVNSDRFREMKNAEKGNFDQSKGWKHCTFSALPTWIGIDPGIVTEWVKPQELVTSDTCLMSAHVTVMSLFTIVSWTMTPTVKLWLKQIQSQGNAGLQPGNILLNLKLILSFYDTGINVIIAGVLSVQFLIAFTTFSHDLTQLNHKIRTAIVMLRSGEVAPPHYIHIWAWNSPTKW